MLRGWVFTWLCLLCPLTTAQSLVFNFEISLHVKDEIRQLMELGTRPARVLNSAFTQTRLMDPHDFNGTQNLYFYFMQVFQEAQALYCSFEDGSQTAYVRNNATIPLLYLVNGINCTNCRYGYDIDSVGTPTALVSRANYDARTRQWYKAAKAQYLSKNTTEMWSAPIFFVVRNVPGVIFTIPLTLPDGEFDGLIALNYDFQDISDYLRSRYENTARLIFVVDHQTGFLLSSSNNASLTLKNATTGVLDLMPANRSENELVSGAMKLLQKEPSVEALVIFQGRFVQSTLYTDSARNILWRIVVIMPANPKKDYVLWTEPAGIGITVLAILACCVSLSFIVWMFYHREAKLVKMSRVSFVATFLFGCLFLNVSLFFMMGPNTTEMCWLRAWFGPLMMAIAIAPLVLKTWWIYWIFSHPMAPRPPSKSDFEKLSRGAQLKVLATGTFARVVLVVIGEAIILAVGTGLDSPAPVETTTMGADGFYNTHTFCGAPSQPFVWINNLYFAVLFAAACICAFQARNINENLAESRSITVAVYATALFTLAVQIVRGSQTLEIAPDSILSAVGIVWGTTFSTLAVLGPRAFKLFTIGDDAACAWLQAGRKPVSSFLSTQPTTNGDRESRMSEVEMKP